MLLLLELLFVREGVYNCNVLSSHDIDDLIDFIRISRLCELNNNNNNIRCKNKSSAVAEMGDRGHNSHGPKRGGLVCPFRGES